MTIYIWPIELFRAANIQWGLFGRTIQGGQSISGQSQAVRTDGGGLWRATHTGIILATRDEVRAWRAWEAILDGGAANVVVPMNDTRFAPLPVGVEPGEIVPHSDDQYFSDDTGYLSSLITAETVGTADLRATTVVLDITVGSALRGGEHFSLDHPTKGRRLYRVVLVTGTVGTQHTVEIRPPLREATTDGMEADFDRPSCTMRLIMPDNMPAELGPGAYATVQAAFLESF